MATKIDNEKLDQYIGELNSLHVILHIDCLRTKSP